MLCVVDGGIDLFGYMAYTQYVHIPGISKLFYAFLVVAGIGITGFALGTVFDTYTLISVQTSFSPISYTYGFPCWCFPLFYFILF